MIVASQSSINLVGWDLQAWDPNTVVEKPTIQLYLWCWRLGFAGLAHQTDSNGSIHESIEGSLTFGLCQP